MWAFNHHCKKECIRLRGWWTPLKPATGAVFKPRQWQENGDLATDLCKDADRLGPVQSAAMYGWPRHVPCVICGFFLPLGNLGTFGRRQLKQTEAALWRLSANESLAQTREATLLAVNAPLGLLWNSSMIRISWFEVLYYFFKFRLEYEDVQSHRVPGRTNIAWAISKDFQEPPLLMNLMIWLSFFSKSFKLHSSQPFDPQKLSSLSTKISSISLVS